MGLGTVPGLPAYFAVLTIPPALPVLGGGHGRRVGCRRCSGNGHPPREPRILNLDPPPIFGSAA